MSRKPKNTCQKNPQQYAIVIVYAISDLKRFLGFTDEQLHNRLTLLLPAFANDCKEAGQGQIIVGHQILTALRRMEQLEQRGLPPGDATKQVIQELLPGQRNIHSIAAQQATSMDQSRALERLRTEKSQLLEEVAFLRQQVEELTTVAKILPKRRLRSLILYSVGRKEHKRLLSNPISDCQLSKAGEDHLTQKRGSYV